MYSTILIIVKGVNIYIHVVFTDSDILISSSL